jgi:hypothetical protein
VGDVANFDVHEDVEELHAAVDECWGLTGDEAAALLGLSASTWDRIRAGSWGQALTWPTPGRASPTAGYRSKTGRRSRR